MFSAFFVTTRFTIVELLTSIDESGENVLTIAPIPPAAILAH